MSEAAKIPHYDQVDVQNIVANFTDDLLHRSSLTIPFIGRKNGKRLCIIGQNPSAANEQYADKTLRYLEQFVFLNLPEYSNIIMLNLYSRIDTSKKETTDLDRPETISELKKHIEDSSDFLLVFGATEQDGKYHFANKILNLKKTLMNKKLYKIDILSNTSYPPHPGNPKILYKNFDYGIIAYVL